MADEKDPKPGEEAEAVLKSIKTPDPKRDPAKDIEDDGAPSGADFA